MKAFGRLVVLFARQGRNRPPVREEQASRLRYGGTTSLTSVFSRFACER